MVRRKKAAEKSIDQDDSKAAVEPDVVVEVTEVEAGDDLKDIEKHDTEPPPPTDRNTSPPPAGGVLVTEMEIRRHALAVCEALLPSKVGDEKFEWMTQGRSLNAKKRSQLFSTCGELAHAILECIGYRGPCLNRELTSLEHAEKRKYQVGQNLALIYGAEKWRKSNQEGLWVKCRPAHNCPSIGDVLYVSNGPPRTEHVSIFAGINLEETKKADEGCEVWDVWQAGQGGKLDQHGGKGTVTYSVTGRGRRIAKLNDRQFHGWLDIGKLAGKLKIASKLPPV